MIFGRYCHDVISMGNKMFVVGYVCECEMFDSICRKFTLIKDLQGDQLILYNSNIVANVGHKFTVYSAYFGESVIYSYDVVAEKWYKEDKKLEEVKCVNHCIRVPST